MYGWENWTIKKAECRRMDDFGLWCWRRLLRVPWTARRSNQSVPKEISPGCSLEVLMLKLKLQYFGHLMQKADSSEKTLKLGNIEGRRKRGWQRMRRLDGITDGCHPSRWVWVDSGSWWWTGRPGVLQFMGSQRVGHIWATELNWTEWRWWNSSWAISNLKRWCSKTAALSKTANLENSAVATRLEKVSFHSNPKESQCQRMFKQMHSCTHLTC